MRKLFFYCLVAIVTFASCRKEEPSVNVIIEGIVVDEQTNAPISGADIEMKTNKKTYTQTTDESGYFNLGSFKIGDYLYKVYKKGYSTEIEYVYSFGLGLGEHGYDVVANNIVELSPMNYDARLTLYRQISNDGEKIAAANFPYKIVYGSNDPIAGTTDSRGMISIDSLPSSFTIIIDHVFNGIKYKLEDNIYLNRQNSLTVYGYNPEADFGLVSINILDTDGIPVEDFDVASNIIMEFTLPVDTATFSIDLDEYYGWYSVDFTGSWSNSNMVYTINPTSNLDPEEEYVVDINIESLKGQSYYNSITFMTAQ